VQKFVDALYYGIDSQCSVFSVDQSARVDFTALDSESQVNNFVAIFKNKHTLYFALEIIGNAFHLLREEHKLLAYEKVARKAFKIY
jgi:hypothetical protein